MKKSLFLLIALLCVSFCKAEMIELGEFTQSAYNSTKKVMLSTEENGKYSIYIEVSGDAETYFIVSDKKLNNFRIVLTEIRDKFAEWENVAKVNNVKDTKKNFPQSFTTDVAWYTSKWWLSTKNVITPSFRIGKEGDCKMIAYTNAVAWNNEYIKNSCILVLTSVDDFNSLLDIISNENINIKLNTQDNKNDLFQ